MLGAKLRKYERTRKDGLDAVRTVSLPKASIQLIRLNFDFQ